MKIAHIAPPWFSVPPMNYGGTELVIYNLVEEQVAQGHDVTLFASGEAQTSAKLISFFQHPLSDTGVPWAAHLKAYYHYCKAIDALKEHDFDIVHTHLSSAADMYIFPLAAHSGITHVMTLHSQFPFDRVGDWTGDADQYYMEWAARVPMVAISERARDEVPYPLNFVGVVHHGIPMPACSCKQPEDFFVWLGRIVAEKGTHLAIEAAKKAGVPLVLAGNVDNSISHAVSYFEERIQPQIDNQTVKYVGPVNMQQKTDLLSCARGLLNPIMWEEPFGMVMIEAMAYGCPVISFARGAAPEIIHHRKSGFLAHDVEDMAHYITHIDMLDRATVRSHVEQHFSSRSMAEKYISIYKKVIASQAPHVRVASPAASAGMSTSSISGPTSFKTTGPVSILHHPAPFARATVEAEPAP
jgi:glycosyltransferase involved in cell wall biosynthesis